MQDIYVLDVASLHCRPMGALLEGGRCLHSCASLGAGSLLVFGGVTARGESVNDLLLLEQRGGSSAAHLAGKVRALEAEVGRLARDLAEEAAAGDSLRSLHTKQVTRNSFLEASLKEAIEHQKEFVQSHRAIKGKLSKHKINEEALRQSCR